MAEKKLKTRIINKHETQENWEKATNFIPLEGEVIIYDPDNNHKKPRIKIGDGILNPETGIVEGTNVNDLPFITDSNLSDGTKNKAVYQKSEKTGDPELSFGFTDLVSRDVEVPSGTHNRETETGINAISLGTSLATGKRSFAMGSSNIAGGDGSTPANVAMGKDNYAKGDASFALGYANYTEGNFSMASGQQTQTIGEASHTEGNHTKAIGNYSHAEGLYSEAEGVASHAEGGQSNAKGNNSHAEGEQTKAIGENSHAEGRESNAEGKSSHAEGYLTHAKGENSHAEGYDTVANGIDSHSEGGITKAIGDYSHAEGQNTEATGNSSHAEGIQSKAIEYGSHAEGYKTEAKLQAHAEGNSTKAYGNISHAEGFLTKAEGEMSHAEGYSTEAIGKVSHASGVGTVASAYAQTTVGRYNEEKSDALFIVGNGYIDENDPDNPKTIRQNAFVVKNDGTVFANDKELSTKEYVDTLIGNTKSSDNNKSLVFDTKAKLDSWINETPCGKNLLNPWDYDPNNTVTGDARVNEDGSIRITTNYELVEGAEDEFIFSFTNYNYKFTLNKGSYYLHVYNMPLNPPLDVNIIVDGADKSDLITYYSIEEDSYVNHYELLIDLQQQSDIELNITSIQPSDYDDVWVQLEKGTTPTEYETYIPPYVRENDHLTKNDLNIGDLLLVKEENVPDYYWDGNKIIELEISLPENIVTKEELSNKISLWQPNTEYKVGDVVIAKFEEYMDLQDQNDYNIVPNRTIIAKCVEQHTSQNIFSLYYVVDGRNKLTWEILQETYAYYDALGRRIHNTYATKDELEEALDGINGTDGVSVTKTEINNKGELVITLSDNTVSNLGVVIGAKGEKGDTGATGATGDKGDKGDAGANGKDGYTPVKGVDYYTPEDEVKIIADVMENLTQSNIPEYWEEHLDEKIFTIKALQDQGGKNCFSFVVMTDLHYPANLGKFSPTLAKKIMDECGIKYALVLGDVRNRGCYATKELAQTEWNNIEEMFKPLNGRMLMTQGNHDAGYGTGDYDGDGDTDTFVYEFTPAEMFERVYRKASFTSDVVYDASGTAFYVDDKSNKVRYILLNTQLNFDGNIGYNSYEAINGMAKYPSMWKFRYTQCQYDFLINDALTTVPADDWGVVIASHIPINQTGEMPEYPVMVGVLNAYQNKESYNGTYAGTTGGGAAYTNLAEPLPDNTTDTTKWVNGYYISSSGIAGRDGATVSNLISCKNGDIIRIKGVTLREKADRIAVYGSTLNGFASAYFNLGLISGSETIVKYNGLSDGVYTFTVQTGISHTITGFRFAMPTPEDVSGIIVTVNEEIVETEHGYDYVSVDCDFSNAKGELICYNSGHIHKDSVFTTCYPSGSLEFPIITTRCDAAEENDADLKSERIEGTTTEQSFDVFTVNKAEGKIYVTKIGAGDNREIPY